MIRMVDMTEKFCIDNGISADTDEVMSESFFKCCQCPVNFTIAIFNNTRHGQDDKG